MRVGFIGCVGTSMCSLEILVGLNVDVRAVITREMSPFNADHVNLKPFCDKHGLPCRYADSTTQDDALAFLRQSKIDYLFCIGWSSLLSAEVLAIPTKGVIGFHPAPLPQGRGRHPIIWALVLGLNRTASSFFFMDEGADSGDIISQYPILIDNKDDATSLYKKISETMQMQLREFIPKISSGTCVATPQDHSKASYWRKRTKEDGRIDFRMDAETIHNLVRALSPPYSGAQIVFGGREYIVWKTMPASCDDVLAEPGKVLDVTDGQITVKCGNNAIVLCKHEIDMLPHTGDYLL